MSDSKISALPTKAVPVSADILPIVDSTVTDNKKITIGTLPISTATQTALNAKVTANAAIVAATKTKITYDTKGLVTSGTDATTGDIADSTDKRYVTDAQLTVISNTSGTNTGDQDLSSLALQATTISTTSPLTGGGDLSANRTLSIPAATTLVDGYLTSTDWATFNGKQDALGFTPANENLSNLVSTAVNTNLVPQDDKVQELGQDTKAWAAGFFSELKYDSSKNIDVENRLLKNVDNNVVVNYQDAIINDKSGILSIDAEARKLGAALDYSNNSNVSVSSDFTAPGSIYADAVKPGSVIIQSLIGNGFLELPAQTSGVVGAPSTTGWRMHTTALSALAFKDQSSRVLSFNTSAMTGSVELSVGNTTGTIATIAYVDTKIGNTFESVSKNLRQYNYALNYSSGVLTTIVYTVPSVGTITKTLNYSSGLLTSVVLSGSTPASIQLTKTLTYSSGVLTSIAYT